MRMRCRFCGCDRHRPAGYRYTKRGRKRLYRCLACGRKFTPGSAFLGMRHDQDIITQCIDLYMSGLSFRGISQHMGRRGIEVSHMSVYRWVRKYSRMLKPYADSFKVDGQDGNLHADEMMVQLKGRWIWIWNVMSGEKRYVLASRVSRTREMVDAKALLREARSKIEGMPMRLTTDGLGTYPRAFNSVFYTNTYPRVEHYVAPGITGYHQNNLIERHHNSMRCRTKTMRGFCEMDSVSDTINMWNIYFNFLRPNMALGGRTPAESAGLGKHDLKGMIEDAYEWKG